MRIKYNNLYEQIGYNINGENKLFEISLNESPRNYFDFQGGIRHISVSGVGGTYGFRFSYLPGIELDILLNTAYQFQLGLNL